ncbi:hypothetical protein DFJ77DRAFT_481240 [Powellomyces hirtus]|nr:hypothetical protein DFJ77DRAFT_481240 [Powellomyces hirtus]
MDLRTVRGAEAIMVPRADELIIMGGWNYDNVTKKSSLVPDHEVFTRIAYKDFSITETRNPLYGWQLDAARNCWISARGNISCGMSQMPFVVTNPSGLLECDATLSCNRREFPAGTYPRAIGILGNTLLAGFDNNVNFTTLDMSNASATMVQTPQFPWGIMGYSHIRPWNDSALLVMQAPETNVTTTRSGLFHVKDRSWTLFDRELDPFLQIKNYDSTFPRDGFGQAARDGKMYIFGGLIGVGEDNAFNDVQMFDTTAPEKGWTILSPPTKKGEIVPLHQAGLNMALRPAVAVVADMMFVCCGGPKRNVKHEDTNMYFFNLTSRTWVADLIDIDKTKLGVISSATASAKPGPGNEGSSNRSRAIGGAVGGVLALLVLTALVWWSLRRREQGAIKFAKAKDDAEATTSPNGERAEFGASQVTLVRRGAASRRSTEDDVELGEPSDIPLVAVSSGSRSEDPKTPSSSGQISSDGDSDGPLRNNIPPLLTVDTLSNTRRQSNSGLPPPAYDSITFVHTDSGSQPTSPISPTTPRSPGLWHSVSGSLSSRSPTSPVEVPETLFTIAADFKASRPTEVACRVGDSVWLIERLGEGMVRIHNATTNSSGAVPENILAVPKQS